MKLISTLSFLLLSSNIYATELRFDSIDCTKADHPPLQSKIIVSNQANSFFTVKIVGGYPAWNANLPHTCVDANFGGANFNKDTQSIDAYAVYSEPYLYVLIQSKENADIAGENKQIMQDNPHALVFMQSNQGFILLRDEGINNSQKDISSWYTVYNALKPQVIYQIADDAGLKLIIATEKSP